MAASNTRFTQNSLGQSKTPIDSDHGIYRYRKAPGKAGAISRCKSDPGKAVAGRLEASVA